MANDQMEIQAPLTKLQLFAQRWGAGLLLTMAALLWLALVGVTWAEAADSDDEYSFSWLDPEKKIYVLQNRKYLKTGRPMLSVMGGFGFSNPYKSTYNFDPRFAYYLNETWGMELFYTVTGNVDNNTLQVLNQSSPNTIPSIREIRSQYGAMIHYIPWYAKINVYNSILYFDWYFGAGAGNMQTFVNTQTVAGGSPNFVQQDQFALFLSTGHQYRLTDHFLVRLDMTASIYQAPINGLTGNSAWYANINFGAGIGWQL